MGIGAQVVTGSLVLVRVPIPNEHLSTSYR